MKRVALTFAIATLASNAAAQPTDKKPPVPAPAPAPPPVVVAPPPLHASAILRLAHEIAQGIGQVPSGAIVVASAVASDIPAPMK